MDAPLISVIVPVYKVETYLDRCVQSIVDQTYQNLEIILVDDGSPDNCPPMCDAWTEKDSRIRVIHKENGGVTSARLRGVAEAKGAYIGFVDGDDFVEPQMYAHLMENLQKYNADISHCGYQMVFPSRVDYYYNTGRLVAQENEQGCTDLLDGAFVEPALVNKLYRKELFVGLREWMDPSIRINEDLLMNFYLFRQAQMSVFEDLCHYHYVLRPGSATTSRLNEHKLEDPLRVLHLLLGETVDQPQWNAIVRRRIIYQLINTASLSLGDQKELIQPVRLEARRELRQRLWSALTDKRFGAKLKIMALWAAIWPWSYGFAHQVYLKISGLDKKYSLE